MNSPENEELQIASSTLQEDATAAVQATKRKRSNDARTAAQVSLSFTVDSLLTDTSIRRTPL